MKKNIIVLIGGALFLCFTSTSARPYYLYSSIEHIAQKATQGSRMPKRPLNVDLSGHILTIPNQLIGYGLILKDKDGEIVYCHILFNNSIVLPDFLEGEFSIQITNGRTSYKGELSII